MSIIMWLQMRALPIQQLLPHHAPPGIYRVLLCAFRMLPYILKNNKKNVYFFAMIYIVF